MNISFYTHSLNRDITRGYGNAGFNMVRSLQQLGHTVPFDDPACKIQISLCQPSWYKFHDGQYKIGYTPWESTELPEGWTQSLNKCDEVWATSQWVAKVFKANGVFKPIYVYEHGLTSDWTPQKRVAGDKIKFLHVGEPALRKGGQMTIDAFRAVFGDSDKVHLTVKAYHQHYLRAWIDGEPSLPKFDNVTINTDLFTGPEMTQLFADHDVLVYPSYGEGFGFIPLQALGTGMPVISTTDWAPYKKFLEPLGISGRWDRSIWSLHPGDVLYPSYEELKTKLTFAVDNIEFLQQWFYSQASQVHSEYNWLTKTKDVFEKLEKRVTES